MSRPPHYTFFFFFNDTATTEIYTLSLHDALPIYRSRLGKVFVLDPTGVGHRFDPLADRHTEDDLYRMAQDRSEEHTSELQSRLHLVCRLLLEKKKKILKYSIHVLTSVCTAKTRTR